MTASKKTNASVSKANLFHLGYRYQAGVQEFNHRGTRGLHTLAAEMAMSDVAKEKQVLKAFSML